GRCGKEFEEARLEANGPLPVALAELKDSYLGNDEGDGEACQRRSDPPHRSKQLLSRANERGAAIIVSRENCLQPGRVQSDRPKCGGENPTILPEGGPNPDRVQSPWSGKDSERPRLILQNPRRDIRETGQEQKPGCSELGSTTRFRGHDTHSS